MEKAFLVVFMCVIFGAGVLAGIAGIIFRERWLEKYQVNVGSFKVDYPELTEWLKDPKVKARVRNFTAKPKTKKVGRGIHALVNDVTGNAPNGKLNYPEAWRSEAGGRA